MKICHTESSRSSSAASSKLTLRLRCVVLLLPLAACDPYYEVVVTARLAQPVPLACAESLFDTVAHPRRPDPVNPSGPPLRGMAFVDGLPINSVLQRRLKDSTVELRTWVGRWNFMGGRFTREEADSVGRTLGPILADIRTVCGGSAPPGAPPYWVKRVPW